ncbi:hypothetical protein [Bacteroides eggerthii]|uniref:hypothetical protein n=1 Tax=Bacteroides eggerthii TaxID=28111 RepID=UPI0022DF114C|nr:hypothetical protein [Bacteroides eggerthii]
MVDVPPCSVVVGHSFSRIGRYVQSYWEVPSVVLGNTVSSRGNKPVPDEASVSLEIRHPHTKKVRDLSENVQSVRKRTLFFFAFMLVFSGLRFWHEFRKYQGGKRWLSVSATERGGGATAGEDINR